MWCVQVHREYVSIDGSKRRIDPAYFIPLLHEFLADNVTSLSPLGKVNSFSHSKFFKAPRI